MTFLDLQRIISYRLVETTRTEIVKTRLIEGADVIYTH